MYCDDITVEDFVGKLKNDQKVFKEIAVEDYAFTLEDFVLDGIEFESCFVNINFKNCSLQKSKFVQCNLKCISFENCDLSQSMIDECAIDGLEILNCNLNGIIFGTNSGLSSEQVIQLFKEGNKF